MVNGKGRKNSMKLSIKNPNHCLYCGKQLSVIHLLRDFLYCNSSHRSRHAHEVNELALLRLLTPGKSLAEIRWEQRDRRLKQQEVVQTMEPCQEPSRRLLS
jgi:hypothetical protein